MVLWYITKEGDSFSYILTNFERLEQGYYISEYDVNLEVFVEEDETYFVKTIIGDSKPHITNQSLHFVEVKLFTLRGA